MTELMITPKSNVPAGDELLRRPTKKELTASITLLFDAFPATQRGAPERVAAAYVIALGEFSAWSIREGVMKLIRGEFPDHQGSWLPSTAIVCRCIRHVAESGPEAVERRWRNSLAIWQSGMEWQSVWGIGPEDPGFKSQCPPHLYEAFRDETIMRMARRRH